MEVFGLQGTVSFFHDRKKYGFIEPEDGGDDVFFHITVVDGESIQEGDEVEFEQEEGDRGPKATNVARIGAAEGADDEEDDDFEF